MESTATKVTITYCTQCNWLLRASWMAGELLQTFAGADIGEVALRPGTGGIFTVHATGPGKPTWIADDEVAAVDGTGEERVDGEARDEGEAILVWDRKVDGGFPDIVDLKRRVRDIIAPDLVLGHADRAAAKAKQDR